MSDTTMTIVRARDLQRDHVIEIGGLLYQIDDIAPHYKYKGDEFMKVQLHLIATQNIRDLKMTGRDAITTLTIPSDYTIQLED